MGLLDNFSQPFRISSLLPSEAQLQAFKQKSDAEALEQFSQDPNPIRRVPFNILTALGVNPTIAQAAPTVADNAPITGDISALADARTAFGQGDLATAGLLTAATLIPGVPAGKVKSLLSKEKKTTPLLFNDLPEQVDPTKTGFIFKGIAKPNLSKSENKFFNDGFGQKEAVLPIRSMNAAQDKVNPDFTITESSSGELPLVIKKDNELFVSDGHHRLTKLAVQGEQNAKVRLVDFDEPTTTPLLDYDPQGSATDKALLEELGIESPNEGLLKKSDDTKPLLNVDDAPKEGIANVVPPTDNEPGIIAFHGSGADFDQFRMDKIGTGEGNQAFGYGLYFTESEDIAKFYKDTTTEVPYDYQLDGQSVSKLYNDAINNQNYQLAEVLEQVQLHDSPKELAERFSVKNGYPKETEEFVKGLNYERITAVDFDGNDVPLGKTYKVALAPKPDELLDYDVSLKNQSEKVRKVLKPYYDKYNVAETADFGTLLASLQRDLPPKLFSEELNKQGIKGIKYKAGQLSGVKDTDATNFVIFDENLINILAKYGIVGSVGITALQNSDI